jgi:hypothetical protein
MSDDLHTYIKPILCSVWRTSSRMCWCPLTLFILLSSDLQSSVCNLQDLVTVFDTLRDHFVELAEKTMEVKAQLTLTTHEAKNITQDT